MRPQPRRPRGGLRRRAGARGLRRPRTATAAGGRHRVAGERRARIDAVLPATDYQCGPAALATVLVASGAQVSPDDLVAEVYLPGRKGSLQAELIAAARSRGRLPYVLPPSLDDLLAQLAAGHPVLVLQKTGAGPWPGWHYAVVIGYDASRDRLLLRSGTERGSRCRRRISAPPGIARIAGP